MTRHAHSAALGAVLALGAALALAAPAADPAAARESSSAHNSVVLTTPVAGETLTELPESFEVRTNDALLDAGGLGGGFAFLVRDAAGLYFGDGCVRIVGTSMFATPALGEPGPYTVIYQLVSADGHTVSDSYEFEWQPASAHTPALGSGEAPRCGEQPSPAGSQAADPGGELGGAGDEASSAVWSELWWIAAALGAVALAVVTALVVARRRERWRREP